MFPFGFGLFYTTFKVAKIATSGSLDGVKEKISVSCKVSNTGDVEGKTVVQFHIQGPADTRIHRAVKELKAFRKLFVEAKATETVIAELEKYTVSYYDIDADSWRAVKGKYHVLVGLSAGEVVGSTSFDVREDFLWKGL